jgi:hypothetical protein
MVLDTAGGKYFLDPRRTRAVASWTPARYTEPMRQNGAICPSRAIQHNPVLSLQLTGPRCLSKVSPRGSNDMGTLCSYERRPAISPLERLTDRVQNRFP